MSDTRILVVEDENIVAKDLQRRLERLGYSVPFVVASGAEAIQRADEMRPDVVLMDIVLKGDMDGIEAATEIVHRLDIPIVFLTAFGDDRIIERAKTLEPLGYILKPFKERELHATIQAGLYRRQIEKRLKDSEERFRLALKNAPVTVAAQDRDLRFLWAYNQRTVDPASVLGKTDADVFPPETAARLTALKNQVLETGKEIREQLWVTSGGKQVFLDLSLDPLRDTAGNITGIGIATVDLTQMKLTQEALRASEERFRVAQELSLDAFTILTAVRDEKRKIVDFRWQYVNPEAGRILGHAPSELIGQRLLHVLPGNKTNSDLFERYVRVVETGEPHDYELRYESEGIQGWFRNMAVKLGDGIAIYFMDITQRKQMEEQLRRHTERTETLASISHLLAQAGLALPTILDTITAQVSESLGDVCMISLISDDGETVEPMTFHHPNPQIAGMLQKTFPLTSFPVGEGLAGQVAKTGKPVLAPQLSQTELRSMVKPEFWDDLNQYGLYSTLIVPIRIQDQIIGTLGVTRVQPEREYTQDDQIFLQAIADRTALAISNARLHAQVARARDELERRVQERTAELSQANQALAESETRFRVLAENAQDLIYRYRLTEPRGFEYVSPSATRLTGYSPQEHYADPDLVFKLVHPDDRPLLDALMRGQYSPTDLVAVRWQRKDGTILWMEQRHIILRDSAGIPIAIQGIARDITERKQAEAALRESNENQHAILNSTTDSVLLMDLAGIVIALNESTAQRVGKPVGDLLGKSIYDGLPPDVAEERKKHVAQVVQNGAPLHFVDRRLGRWIENSLFPIFDLHGRVTRLAVYGRDVTEQKDIEEQIQKTAARTAALVQSAARLNSKLEFQTVLQTVCEEAAYSLNVPAAMVALYNEQSDTLNLAAEYGLPHEYRVRFQSVSRAGYDKLAQKHGSVFAVPDSQTHEEFAELSLGFKIPRGAIASMFRDKQLIGILYAMTLAHPREFTEDDLALLMGLADQAGLAIDNARLYETAQRRSRQLQTLRGIDQAISANFDLKVTLRLFLLEALNELCMDAINILLLEPHAQTLVYSAGRGFHDPAVEQTRLRLGDGVDGLAVLERRTLHVPKLDATQNLRQFDWVHTEGFVSYCGVPLIAKGKILGMLNLFHRRPIEFEPEFVQFIETLAGQVAIAIDNATLFTDLERSNSDLIIAYDTTLEGWSRALDLRDKETEGHTQRVTEMTVRLARAAEMAETEIVHVRRGALLHDIGKIGIPDQILLKPGPLTEEEWTIMRRHPDLAADLLSPIPYLRPALDIPLFHHEKWDGTGYPRGLSGEEIPMPARLFAIVDFWDALRSERPYRPAWSEERVRQLIREDTGKHFDPQVVELFLQMIGPELSADREPVN